MTLQFDTTPTGGRSNVQIIQSFIDGLTRFTRAAGRRGRRSAQLAYGRYTITLTLLQLLHGKFDN